MSLDIRFDTYYPYEPLVQKLEALCATYPNLLKMQTIGKSYEGRDVWLVTATNFATGPAEEKPAFWCDGNIHATEVSASSACLYLLYLLATEYGKRPDITRALDTRTFYVLPRVNPDGAELYFAEKPKFIRSSVRPYPYDEDPIEGLIQEDIDGDGLILQMRIPDPNGPWKPHPEDPRLLIRRDPTETGGNYYRVLPEGRFENFDGLTMRVAPQKEGLDLNRNFPAHWRQEGEQRGAGPFPGSEPEVYNMVRFITAHPNITGAITFHTYSGVLLRPYGTQADEAFPAEDLWTYQTIGKKGTEITGYPAVSVFHDFKYHPKEVITGVFDDWMYDHLGVFAWTVEIWSPQRQAGLTEGFDKDTKPGQFRFIDWYRDHPIEEDLKMLHWSDTVLEGKGFIPWRPFLHPQLGEIEIGGWNAQYAFRNPPPPLLEKEIAPLAEWAVWHALISPRLELASATVEPVGDGAYLIRLVVDNTGWLPTYVCKKALEKKVVRDVVVEITLPEGATLRSGKLRAECGQLEGRAYKGTSPYGWAADPTEQRLKAEWIVCGRPGDVIALTARHERAGVVRAAVSLP
ncbi:MAG: M14 family metallopeptidase [Chloroherpetonaceae bacterium]|nr:M14 family metallopeptidase [Chthonomonadaceae bacterium]MDW8206199.1 M14 family metallopeptidase [Chloroherpetonaceae bacterium]